LGLGASQTTSESSLTKMLLHKLISLSPRRGAQAGRQSFTSSLFSPPRRPAQRQGRGANAQNRGNISPLRPSILVLLYAYSKKLLQYLT